MSHSKIKSILLIFVISLFSFSGSFLDANANTEDKILVCHKTGIGFETIEVANIAAQNAHLRHGDSLGPCVNIECPTGQELVGNECVNIECPTGQELVGNECVNIECPTGQELVGNECYILLDDDGSGGDNQWDTRPTFGVNHETRETMMVDRGFIFNDYSFTITDNHYTPFDKQTIEIGAVNSFGATVWADKNLKVQEFLFGVPGIGMGHLAEIRVEVWFDYEGKIEEVKVLQDTEVIDRASLTVTHQKSKCLESDIEEKCDTTFLSTIFLETLRDQVMAIKAMDFELRDHTTYLNDGFDISGDSLNPMPTKMIPSPVKGEGLIKVTQNEKYSKYWTTDNDKIFEMNTFGSFKQINYEFKRFQDLGESKTRHHSEFANKIKSEADRAKKIFDASELSFNCNFVNCQ